MLSVNSIKLYDKVNISFQGSWQEYVDEKEAPFEKLAGDFYESTCMSLEGGNSSPDKQIRWERINEKEKDAVFTRQAVLKGENGNNYIIKTGRKANTTYTSFFRQSGKYVENLLKKFGDEDGYLYSSRKPTRGENFINEIFEKYPINNVSIFISDLHLGKGDVLERFENDKYFKKFLEDQSYEHDKDSVDLVMLGDVIDIWSLVPDDELYPEKISDIKYMFPMKGKNKSKENNLRHSVENINELITKVFEAHPDIPEAVQKFLVEGKGDRRIIYVIGNHDHAAVIRDVQNHIKHQLLGDNYTKLRNQIQFSVNYDNPDMAVYAEHGNQYEAFNRYHKFLDPYEEVPSCYQNVFFKNRYKAKFPKAYKDSGLLKNLLDIKKVVGMPYLFFEYYFDYLNDDRIPYKKKIFGVSEDYIGEDKNFISLDISNLKSFLSSLTFLPEIISGERYRKEAAKMFCKNGSPSFHDGNLIPYVYKTVIMGHTHKEDEFNLQNGVKYYNTGTWQEDSPNPFVKVIKSEDDNINSFKNNCS